VTFALFALVYFSTWTLLIFLHDEFADYIFLTFTWLGFAFGGSIAYTFFKYVKSLKVRGLVIVALCVPLEIFSQYL